MNLVLIATKNYDLQETVLKFPSWGNIVLNVLITSNTLFLASTDFCNFSFPFTSLTNPPDSFIIFVQTTPPPQNKNLCLAVTMHDLQFQWSKGFLRQRIGPWISSVHTHTHTVAACKHPSMNVKRAGNLIYPCPSIRTLDSRFWPLLCGLFTSPFKLPFAFLWEPAGRRTETHFT